MPTFSWACTVGGNEACPRQAWAWHPDDEPGESSRLRRDVGKAQLEEDPFDGLRVDDLEFLAGTRQQGQFGQLIHASRQALREVVESSECR